MAQRNFGLMNLFVGTMVVSGAAIVWGIVEAILYLAKGQQFDSTEHRDRFTFAMVALVLGILFFGLSVLGRRFVPLCAAIQ